MMNSNLQSVRRWLQVVMLALLANGGWRSAAAQDVAIITRAEQKEMLKNPGTPAAWQRDNPDVVIVKYFDYNCPYYRRLYRRCNHCWRRIRRSPWCTRIGRSWGRCQCTRPALRWRQGIRGSIWPRTMH